MGLTVYRRDPLRKREGEVINRSHNCRTQFRVRPSQGDLILVLYNRFIWFHVWKVSRRHRTITRISTYLIPNVYKKGHCLKSTLSNIYIHEIIRD